MTETLPAPGFNLKSVPPDSVAFDKAKKLLAQSRIVGRVSAFLFFIVALSVLDGLQSLVRHEFNSIDLVAGQTVMVSGIMPVEAAAIEDLKVEFEGEPGLIFEGLETYKGFWMGGFMWRANLTASPNMRPGKIYFTIEDIIKPEPSTTDSTDDRDKSILFGGQQNPALVYAVSVWPDALARQNADHSFFTRVTGFPVFWVAAAFILLALIAGIANWRTFVQAEAILGAHSIFYIHGIKKMGPEDDAVLPGKKPTDEPGYKVIFSRLEHPFTVGDHVLLLDKDWMAKADGVILNVERFNAHACFAVGAVKPVYGWFVQRKR